MSAIAILGVGAMGGRMAASLLSAGHSVTVWNRNPARCTPLLDLGAQMGTTPALAATGAEFVLSMVRDDAAAHQVWLDAGNGALAAMAPDSIGIECSTLSRAGFDRIALAFAQERRQLLDAPVSGSRPQAEARQLIFLVGGDASTLERAHPVLADMGSDVHHVGPQGSGNAVKLIANGLFATQVAALAESIGFMRKAGIEPAAAVAALAATPIMSAAAKGAAVAMLADNFNPLFPVELVDKDLQYLQHAAAQSGAFMPLSQASGAVFERAFAAGLGATNLTGVVRLYA